MRVKRIRGKGGREEGGERIRGIHNYNDSQKWFVRHTSRAFVFWAEKFFS